jgi:hypothetical protein
MGIYYRIFAWKGDVLPSTLPATECHFSFRLKEIIVAALLVKIRGHVGLYGYSGINKR